MQVDGEGKLRVPAQRRGSSSSTGAEVAKPGVSGHCDWSWEQPGSLKAYI